MSSPTRLSIVDFSGGLNTNARTQANELKECVNCDLMTDGAVKPAQSDELEVTVSGATCVDTCDGVIYYTVGNYLYSDASAIALGDIGNPIFFVRKMNGVHVIQSQKRCYKVINGTLYALGIDAPTTGPVLTKSVLKTLTLEDFDDSPTAFTGSGLTVAAEGTIKKVAGAGTYSLKLTSGTAYTYEYAYRVLAADVDLTHYGDGTDSPADDYITMWVRCQDVSKLVYMQLLLDCNGGSFDNDYYYKTLPLMPTNYSASVNENETTSFNKTDYSLSEMFDEWYRQYTSSTNWSYETWQDVPMDREAARQYFDTNYTDPTSLAKQLGLDKKVPSDNIAPTSATWTKIKIRKSDFIRHGETASKDWSTIRGIRLVLYSNAASLDVYVDDIVMTGGGNLNGDYKVSYSYLAKHTLSDGSTYEEESAPSPETEVTGLSQQNITVGTFTSSSDTQVTWRRVYIRGGNLVPRYFVADVDTCVASYLIDDKEVDIALNSLEDCRKNEVPPEDITHSAVCNGKLFLAKGTDVYFSRLNRPGAFYSLDYITVNRNVNALKDNGSNVIILGDADESIYVNAGVGAQNGGYLHQASTPHGCISTRSQAGSFYASKEGIAMYTGTEPQIVSHRITGDLLDSNINDGIGAYLRGKYYLCDPSAQVVYMYDTVYNRFQKYGIFYSPDLLTSYGNGILAVAAGNDGYLYLLKSDGIYCNETGTTRKAFSFRTSELVVPDDQEYRNLVIDCDAGDATLEVVYYVNDTVTNTFSVTTSGRQLVYNQVSQNKGNRVSVKIYTIAEAASDSIAVYGIYLQV